MTRRVVLHIDALHLAGFDPGSSQAIAEGMREELVRAFGSGGLSRALARRPEPVARLRTAPVRVAHDATPRRVGGLVAGGIVNGVVR